MKDVLLALAFVSLVPRALAQDIGTKTQKKCVVEGIVLKTTTGAPVKKAVVTAQRVLRAGEQPEAHTARTSADGRFTLPDLEPGAYSLWVQRNGYIGQAYGQQGPNRPGKSLRLGEGQRVTDVVFRLVPMGAVAGRVYDEDGEPVSSVYIEALRPVVLNGRPQLSPAMGSSSNDMGEYRLAGLMPGKYLLRATYSASELTDDSASQNYVPVYYPGTSDVASATSVEVPAGEEVSQIDFTLEPVPAVRVRGQVLNPAPGESAIGLGVSLMRFAAGGGWGYSNRYVASDLQGNFEFKGVPPGSYVLVTSWSDGKDSYAAREAIEVGDADLDGITLRLVAPSAIRGRVHAEGNWEVNFHNLQVSLQGRDAYQAGTSAVTVEPDGSFVLSNVAAGSYQISVCCLTGGLYLKSAYRGAENVLENGLDVGGTSARESLDLILSPSGGRIEGLVRREAKPTPATVVLVPDPSRRAQTHLFIVASANSEGSFSFWGIPPGDYELFAWENIENIPYQDPDLLRPYRKRARAVRVEPSDQLKVELELIKAEETPP